MNSDKQGIDLVSAFLISNQISRSRFADAVPCQQNPGDLKITLKAPYPFADVKTHTLSLGDSRLAKQAQQALRRNEVKFFEPAPLTIGW